MYHGKKQKKSYESQDLETSKMLNSKQKSEKILGEVLKAPVNSYWYVLSKRNISYS